jgi:outer membrane protein, heavy metal efflux system
VDRTWPYHDQANVAKLHCPSNVTGRLRDRENHFVSIRTRLERAPYARSRKRDAAFAISALALSLTAAPASLTAQATADTSPAGALLQRLRSAAAVSSPGVNAARAELEATRARARAAGLAAPAYLSAGISEAPNGNLDQGNLRLEVGRTLFTGTRQRAERTLAEAEVQAAEVALAAAMRQVDAVMRREVIRAAGEQLVASRLGAEDALLLSAEEGLRTRFTVGEARYTDVLRLRTERLRVQSERASAIAGARGARITLLGIVGDSLRDDVQPALDALAATDFAAAWRALLPASDALDSLVGATGDVQLAAAAVARARASQALAAAERRPQVDASAGVQRIGQANDGPTLGPSVGVTVSLPFTARRANRLGAQAAASEVAAAEAGHRATVATVRARTSAAAERYGAARQRLEVFDAALLRGARDEREAALAAYRTRGISLLELIDFERALARAEIDRIEALIDAADAWADLVTGGAADDAFRTTTTAHEAR